LGKSCKRKRFARRKKKYWGNGHGGEIKGFTELSRERMGGGGKFVGWFGSKKWYQKRARSTPKRKKRAGTNRGGANGNEDKAALP